MTPFAWYDHFNDTFYRDYDSAARAVEGGNKVTPVYEDADIPSQRFTAAVAAMQGILSASYEGWMPSTLAEASVKFANALLAELSKDG